MTADIHETAFLFPCAGESLLGIVAVPPVGAERDAGGEGTPGERGDIGVVVVVGGPQYRAGSHRQFVMLARELAAAGVPCLRFDYRGMGDASGAQSDFLAVDEDIRAAIDAFQAHCPGVRRVVLWGLCDGASAASLYAPQDERVAGLVLLNPWVHTAEGEARTRLRHYYLKRLLSRAFWRKLFSGGVKVGHAVGGVVGAAQQARTAGAGGTATHSGAALPQRMLAALQRVRGPIAFVLSSRDYVAREFEDAVKQSREWRALIARQGEGAVLRIDASHTFSAHEAKARVAQACIAFVRALPQR